jgi:hypothetical protein
MRWVQFILGVGLILTAVGITVGSWRVIVDVDTGRRADSIATGMTRQRVEAILEPSDSSRFLGTGSVKPGGTGGAPIFTESRWEDAYWTVDVKFLGDTVTEVTRQAKVPADLASLRWTRLNLVLLALSGLALLFAGLRSRTRQPAAVTPAA